MARRSCIVTVAAVMLVGAVAAEAAGPKGIGSLTLVGRPGLEALPIVGFAWSSRTTTTADGSGGSATKLAFDDFHVTKLLDASSPALYQLQATGIGTAEVHIDATIRRGTTVSYVLSDVRLISNERRTSDRGGPPTQDLGFSARAIRETVTGPGGSVTSCFDVGAVAACE